MSAPTPLLSLHVEPVPSEDPTWMLDSFPAARKKLDELFMHWLSLPEAGTLISSYLDDIEQGRPIEVPTSPKMGSPVGHLSPRMKAGTAMRSSAAGSSSASSSPPPCSPKNRRASPMAALSFSIDGCGSVSSAGQLTVGPNSPGRVVGSPPASPSRGIASPPSSPVHVTTAAAAEEEEPTAAAAADAMDVDVAAAAAAVAGSSNSGGHGGGRAGAGSSTAMSAAAAAAARSAAAADAAAAAAAISIPAGVFSAGAGGRHGGRFGRGRPEPADSLANRSREIDQLFDGHADGLGVDDFVAATKDLCGFPSFFNAPLFARIHRLFPSGGGGAEGAAGGVAGGADGDETMGGDAPAAAAAAAAAAQAAQALTTITRETFRQFWAAEIAPYDATDRFLRLISQPGSAGIVKEDLLPYLEELLTYHPGLEFLENTPEFQEKYALTVVVRVFYAANTSHTGVLTGRELRRSNLVEMFTVVDEEEDINKVNQYFSYEHFYVLYCKFWELDTDHDFSIGPDDLMKYDHHSLTREIIECIFERGLRPFGRTQLPAAERARMGFEDFVYFMLSEEDKTNDRSLRYWFRCIDMDDDGRITSADCRYFYGPQLDRMACLGHETVPFEDIMCQLNDILKPEEEGEILLRYFLSPDRIALTGVFFNALFNLNKFIAFEQRDPFALRQAAASGLTAWDRFAGQEYTRLAMEEEAREEEAAADMDGGHNWGHGGGGVAEAPF
jgi:serine/threonine-protein phosphatase 2A regulatory subunit B''